MESIDIESMLSLKINNQKNKNIFLKYINQYIINMSHQDITMLLYSILLDIDKLPLKEVLNNIKTCKYNWDNQYFDDIKSNIKEQDNFIVCPFEVDEGVLECTKCGSKKTFSYSKQTRSGDESTTVFATCVMCKSSWKI